MAEQLVYLEENGVDAVVGNVFVAPRVQSPPGADRTGTIVSATSTTTTLEPGASAVDGAYKGKRLKVGAEALDVLSYNGELRRCTHAARALSTPAPSTAYRLVDAQKFFVQNIGDAPYSGSLPIAQVTTDPNLDLTPLMRIAAHTDTLTPPPNPTVALSAPGAGGVWADIGKRQYRIVTTLDGKKTGGSVEIEVDVDDVTKTATPSWDEVPEGDGYEVYRREDDGDYSTPALVATISGSENTSFEDDGSDPIAGALPDENDTGGAAPLYFDTLPAPTVGPIQLELEPGQMLAFILSWSISSGLATATRTGSLAPVSQ